MTTEKWLVEDDALREIFSSAILKAKAGLFASNIPFPESATHQEQLSTTCFYSRMKEARQLWNEIVSN